MVLFLGVCFFLSFFALLCLPAPESGLVRYCAYYIRSCYISIFFVNFNKCLVMDKRVIREPAAKACECNSS
jgi:hypothetical protein